MKNTKLFDAISRIDDRLIDRCLNREKEAPGKLSLRPRNRAKTKGVAFAAVSAVLVLAISLSAAVIFSGRPVASSVIDDQGLKVGFEGAGEAYSSGAKLALKTSKSKLAVGEDLPVSLYCICGSGAESAPSEITAKVVMSYSRINPEKSIETVKEIGDGTAPDYTWNGSFEGLKSEDLVVPAAVFTEDTESVTASDGVLVWALEVRKAYADGRESVDRDSVALYYQIEEDEIYLNPTDESLELARSAVQKLESGCVFLPGSSNLLLSLSDVYESTAKWVAPEMITLETKKDAAVALIKLYEDLLVEYRSCDVERCYQVLTEEYARLNGMSQKARIEEYKKPEYDDEILKVIDLHRTRMTLEALLALDCYYDQLDERMIERMLANFDEFIEIDRVRSKFYDDYNEKPLFSMFRKARGAENGRYL